MARTGCSVSTVIWTAVGLLILFIAIPAMIYGPRLYREGKEMVAPIMEMDRAEEELAALNAKFPFEVPAHSLVDGERLIAFLGIRRGLVPKYENWTKTQRVVEQEKGDSWAGAKDIIGVTRDVMTAQIDLLRQHAMSPREFRWLEEQVYDEWLAKTERSQEGGLPPMVALRLQETAEEDLRFLEDLENRHGRSRAVEEMQRRLRERLQGMEQPDRIEIPGIPEENQRLFWKHRDEIAALKLEHHALHAILREPGSGNVTVRVGGDS